MYGKEARKDLHKLAKDFWKEGIPATGRYVKEAATFDEDGVPTHIPPARTTMLVKVLAAAALVTLGVVIYKQRKSAKGLNKKISNVLGKSLMVSSLGMLGASAPASPAVPSIPMIPAI